MVGAVNVDDDDDCLNFTAGICWRLGLNYSNDHNGHYNSHNIYSKIPMSVLRKFQ